MFHPHPVRCAFITCLTQRTRNKKCHLSQTRTLIDMIKHTFLDVNNFEEYIKMGRTLGNINLTFRDRVQFTPSMLLV